MADFRKMRVGDLEDINNVIVLPATILDISDISCTADVEYILDPVLGVGCEDVSGIQSQGIPIFYHCQWYEKMVDSGDFTETDAFSFGASSFVIGDDVYVIHYPGSVERSLPEFTYIAGHIGRDSTPLCMSDYIFIQFYAPDGDVEKYFCTVFDVLAGAVLNPRQFDPNANFSFPCQYTTEITDWLNTYFYSYANPDPPLWDQGLIGRRHDARDDGLPDYVMYGETGVYWVVTPFSSTPTYTPSASALDFPRIDSDIPYETTVPTGELLDGDSWTGYGKTQYNPTYDDGAVLSDSSFSRGSSYMYRVHDDGLSTTCASVAIEDEYTESATDWDWNNWEIDRTAYRRYYLPWVNGGATPWMEFGSYDVDPRLSTVSSVEQLDYIVGTHGIYAFFLIKYYRTDVDIFTGPFYTYYYSSSFIAFYNDLCGAPLSGAICIFDGMSLDTLFSCPQRSSTVSSLDNAIKDLTDMIENDQVVDSSTYLFYRDAHKYILLKPKTT